jgi:hypothetical protein
LEIEGKPSTSVTPKAPLDLGTMRTILSREEARRGRSNCRWRVNWCRPTRERPASQRQSERCQSVHDQKRVDVDHERKNQDGALHITNYLESKPE